MFSTACSFELDRPETHIFGLGWWVFSGNGATRRRSWGNLGECTTMKCPWLKRWTRTWMTQSINSFPWKNPPCCQPTRYKGGFFQCREIPKDFTKWQLTDSDHVRLGNPKNFSFRKIKVGIFLLSSDGHNFLSFWSHKIFGYLGISTPRDTLISGELFTFPATLPVGVPHQGYGYTKWKTKHFYE